MIKEDIKPGYAPDEISFGGYTTKNLHHSADAAKAFQDTIERAGEQHPAEVLAALRATDTYMKLNDMHLEQGKAPDEKEVNKWKAAHQIARDSLHRIGEFMHHMDYWHMHEHELQDELTGYNLETAGAEMADSYEPQGELVEALTDKTIKSGDKIKVARVIADMLGVEKAESMSPEVAINTGLRSIKNKRMTPELVGVVKKMLALAQEVGIKYDASLAPKAAIAEEPEVNTKSKRNIAGDILRYKDFEKLSKVNQGEDPSETGNTLDVGDEDHLRRMKAKYKTEEADFQLDEAADMATLRKQLSKHTELAVQANKAGNDEAVKKHQEHMNKIKDRMAKLVRSEETELEEDMASADFKVNPETGRKYRAHKINFKNSGMGGKPAEGEDADDRRDMKEEEDKEEDLSDDELEKMASEVDHEDDVMDVYDDGELKIIDQDTGEEVEGEEVKEEQLNEVLSRSERMRARIRFLRTASKRARRLQIVLTRRSDAKTINKRARRLAINMIKQRIARKPASQMNVGEKERIEKMLEKRKALINRLAMKLVPRIRRIESDRLSHGKSAGSSPAPAF